VVVTGGDGELDALGFYQPRQSAELYLPALDAWVYIENLPTRVSGHAAVSLGPGRVLLTGGENSYSDTGSIPREYSWELDKILCSTDGDCATGYACDPNGICRRANGQSCYASWYCASGICANSITSPTGQACSPCPTCQELDGNGACVNVAEGTPCWITLCSQGIQTYRTCSALAACTASTVPCGGGYNCASVLACSTSCSQPWHCLSGYACDFDAGACVTVPPDMAGTADLAVPSDLSETLDLSETPDLSAVPDFAMPPDLSALPDLAMPSAPQDSSAVSDLAATRDDLSEDQPHEPTVAACACRMGGTSGSPPAPIAVLLVAALWLITRERSRRA
jgi:MYXO-CTERM domain-containing protein